MTSILWGLAFTRTDPAPVRGDKALSGHRLQPLAVLAPLAAHGVKIHAL